MASRRRTPLTQAEREQRRRKDRERLEQALSELLTSDGWKRWLRTRSVLHGYSLNNTLLIAHQCAARGIEPTYVAGFKAWLRLGRAVAKGQAGIAIWAPLSVKARDEHGEETDERQLKFRVTHVWDVSQTQPLPGVEPAPLTPPGGEVEGDSHAHLLEPLAQLAQALGYEIGWPGQLAGGARGLHHRSKRKIEVLATLPANGRVAVLIHELSHALLADEDARLPYAAEEVVVEAATHVACRAVGLATDVDSVPYIAGWAGEQDPRREVRQAAELIDRLARTIEHAIVPAPEQAAA